jgi:hypothetical protein
MPDDIVDNEMDEEQPDFTLMIAMADPSMGKTMIALSEEQFDDVTYNVWSTAWGIMWTSMTTIFMPENDSPEEWAQLGERTGRRARKSMERIVSTHDEFTEDMVLTAAIKVTCTAILNQLRKKH